LIYGETDDFGYKSVVDRVGVPDMIATVLHQLGLDHSKTLYPHGGRLETPADVTVTGARVVGGLISNEVQAVMKRLLIWLALPAALFGSPTTENAPVFEKDVLPIFSTYCFTCHGKSSPELGVDLRRPHPSCAAASTARSWKKARRTRAACT
jgi:hypothetical protein